MVARIPLRRSIARVEGWEYALSARTRSGRQRGRPGPRRGTLTAASSGSSWGLSPPWPGGSSVASGSPHTSTRAWTFVLNPPRDRPIACLARFVSTASRFLSFDEAPCELIGCHLARLGHGLLRRAVMGLGVLAGAAGA